MIRRPPRSPLFPSTTPFRSLPPGPPGTERARLREGWSGVATAGRGTDPGDAAARDGAGVADRRGTLLATSRSEEHTSELQSRQYLVCRLLLEKNKKNIMRFM